MEATLIFKDGYKQTFYDVVQVNTERATKNDFIYDINVMEGHYSELSKEIERLVKKCINCKVDSCTIDNSIIVYRLFIKDNEIYINPSNLKQCCKFKDLDLTSQNRIVHALYNQLPQ